MKKASFLFFLLSVCYIIPGFYFSYQSVGYSYHYVAEKNKAIEKLDFEGAILNADNWFSIWNLDGWSKIKNNWQKQNRLASKHIIDAHYNIKVSVYYAFYFLTASIIYFCSILVFFRMKPGKKRFISLSLIFIGLLCLYIGVLTPMLEISAFKKDLSFDFPYPMKDVHFNGDMYFYYQCKSIYDLILLLLRQNNYLVGLSILVFSVIIPLTKLIVTFVVLINKALYKFKVIQFVINKTGKWSMADVFVASTFLSYLSFNNMHTSIQTNSSTLPGLYFFFLYCMISLLLSHLILQQDFNS